MSMLRRLAMLSVPFLILGAGPAVAQSAPLSQSGAPPASSAGTQGTTPENQPPEQAAPGTAAPSGAPACRQQAGISQKAMRTRRSILSNAKTQIQEVNDDTSLAPQQQKQQIRRIRRNAKQQIAKVVTPEQQEALQECQRRRKSDAARSDSLQTSPPGTASN
jgi:Spy/CpxP family protein refolding chaperone